LISTIVRTLGFAAALITAVVTPAAAYVTDAGTHAPPSSGAYAYYSTFGTFGPDRPGFPGVGQTYVDPVFGSTVRRLTNAIGQPPGSDIYGKNGFWNADGTLMFHNDGSSKTIINTTTGAVVRSDVPGNFDGSFAPDDPDTWYYFSGASLRKYSVATGTTSLVKTFSATLGALGGSVDWVDSTGRYMVLNIGGQARVWDKQSDVLYAGPVPGNAGDGWVGISPDAKYVVAAIDDKRSFAINHATRTVNTTGVMFWSLCGGHGDLLSATDGKTYFVTFECYEEAAIYAVDVSLPQTETEAGRAQQRATNRKLMETEWVDDGHIAAAARGMFQDWAFISIESNDDPFTGGVSGWRPYKQEIVMANVLTGELRRLAHHRSRGILGSYFYQPRVSVSWDGTRVGWASNFGYAGPDYGDIYAIELGAAGPPPPPPPPGSPTVTFANPASNATVSGTTTVTMMGAGGSDTGYTYKFTVDGSTVYVGTNGTFGWNTTTVGNGSHTLVATVTDSATNTGTASRVVTVSNSAVTTPPTVTLNRTPTSNAIVSGLTTLTWSASGGSGPYTYRVAVDGITVYSGPHRTIAWNTTTATNGSHTFAVTATDSAAKTGTASRVVRVSNSTNSTSPTVTFSAPAASATVQGSATVTWSASGGSGTGYTYKLAVDGITVYSGTNKTFTWNTTTATNGSHTLVVTVTDSAAKTGAASRAVTVSNTASTTGLVAAFTSPTAGATLGCSQTIGMQVTGSTASTRTFRFYLDIYLVSQTTVTGTTASYVLDTSWWAGSGPHTLKLQVTDSAGRSATTTIPVNAPGC
jgi:Big-like domain-containing protein